MWVKGIDNRYVNTDCLAEIEVEDWTDGWVVMSRFDDGRGTILLKGTRAECETYLAKLSELLESRVVYW